MARAGEFRGLEGAHQKSSYALLDVQSGNTRQGVPDILWTTRFLVDCASLPNVYAELGTTFASSVITFPSVCAHILGQALKFFGEDRIVFGSDGVWYGSPQWQIEALWRFKIPQEMRERYGYPELTDRAKRKILGLNNARLYGIKNVDGRLVTPEECESDDDRYHPVPLNYEALIPISLKRTMEFPGFALNDRLTKLRERYLASGPNPSNTRHDWIRRT